MLHEPEYRFDADTQREVLLDREHAAAWVNHLEGTGLSGDPMRIVWLRILGRLDEAEELGWKVLHRAGGPSCAWEARDAVLPLSSVVAAVCLAHVLQWKGQFCPAHTLYDHALDTIDAVEPMHEDSAYADYLRPFAYQHLARCYFDQGQYEKALAASEKALELRLDAGVPEDQVLSSSGLIGAVRARLSLST